MMPIEANIHPLVRSFLDEKETIQKICGEYEGPVHFLFPEIVEENYRKLQACFERIGVEHRLYVTHKANPSSFLLRSLQRLGAAIDVASLQELRHAIACGFRGQDIECTGPKHDLFLREAIEEGCLMSVDSLDELYAIGRMTKQEARPVSLLFRLGNPECRDRMLRSRPSKFGLRTQDLPEVYRFLSEYPHLQFKGFHLHQDGYDADVRGGFIRDLLRLMYEAHAQGFEPNVINIGGGFRARVLASYTQWSTFIDHLEKQVLAQKVTDVWGSNCYGLRMNERGRIDGREGAMQRAYSGSFETDIPEIFNVSTDDDRPVRDHVRESLMTIIAEPGTALFWNAGLSCAQVMTSKEISTGDRAAFLHANAFNIGAVNGMFESIADPILLAKNTEEKISDNPWWGFLFGNLCTEDDALYRRKVMFALPPSRGDVVCVPNTGAYKMYFTEATPLQQPRGRRYIVQREEKERWKITQEP